MSLPYELALGQRYTCMGRGTRRNGFISFISADSMLGIALGVASLYQSYIRRMNMKSASSRSAKPPSASRKSLDEIQN